MLVNMNLGELSKPRKLWKVVGKQMVVETMTTVALDLKSEYLAEYVLGLAVRSGKFHSLRVESYDQELPSL